MKTIVIEFTSAGTMKAGYMRLWDGTKIGMTCWEAYDLYTRLAHEGHKIVSVMHADSTFTDSIRF